MRVITNTLRIYKIKTHSHFHVYAFGITFFKSRDDSCKLLYNAIFAQSIAIYILFNFVP